MTNPISMGFPIFEAVKSYLSFSDEVFIVVGRDTESFCAKMRHLSKKIKFLVTNLWPEYWTYTDMTYHMNLGLREAEGDIVIKADADSIFADQHQKRINDVFTTRLMKNDYCYLDRLNYYQGYGYGQKATRHLFAVNKTSLATKGIECGVQVNNDGSNTLILGGKEPPYTNEVIIKDLDVIPRNYDDTFCTERQGTEKWYYWHTAKNLKNYKNETNLENDNDFAKIKLDWKRYKRNKALGCNLQLEHPDVILGKLSETQKIF